MESYMHTHTQTITSVGHVISICNARWINKLIYRTEAEEKCMGQQQKLEAVFYALEAVFYADTDIS